MLLSCKIEDGIVYTTVTGKVEFHEHMDFARELLAYRIR